VPLFFSPILLNVEVILDLFIISLSLPCLLSFLFLPHPPPIRSSILFTYNLSNLPPPNTHTRTHALTQSVSSLPAGRSTVVLITLALISTGLHSQSRSDSTWLVSKSLLSPTDHCLPPGPV